MSKRIKLVIHHGAQPTEPSELATKLIQENCKRLGIDYCSTPFFHNANSAGIQQAMSKVAPEIKVIFDRFLAEVPLN
jgi:outer membrane PBP1 activator LpoA protein